MCAKEFIIVRRFFRSICRNLTYEPIRLARGAEERGEKGSVDHFEMVLDKDENSLTAIMVRTAKTETSDKQPAITVT